MTGCPTPRFLLLTTLLVAVGLVGCGGPSYDVLPVSGVVTLDGEPVPQAQVTFLPDQGRPASGITDQEGRYQLSYTVNVDGTPPGTYRVRISTAFEQPDESVAKERLPAKYNTQSELVAEVAPGTDVIDFHLTD